jgi:peptide deformylase
MEALEAMTSFDRFDLDAFLAGEMPPPIVQVGAAVLRSPAHVVPATLLGTPSLLRLIDVMMHVMREAPGVGLAAPQIGVPLRVYVAEDPEERLAKASPEALAVRRRTPLPLTVFVNPKVTADSTELATFYEGCLSVRGYGALVARAAAVRVAAVDPHGRPFALRLEGWPARIMQHEGDHLDGTIYIDRMISRSFAADTQLGRLGAMPVADVLAELATPAKPSVP